MSCCFLWWICFDTLTPDYGGIFTKMFTHDKGSAGYPVQGVSQHICMSCFFSFLLPLTSFFNRYGVNYATNSHLPQSTVATFTIFVVNHIGAISCEGKLLYWCETQWYLISKDHTKLALSLLGMWMFFVVVLNVYMNRQVGNNFCRSCTGDAQRKEGVKLWESHWCNILWGQVIVLVWNPMRQSTWKNETSALYIQYLKVCICCNWYE